MRVGLRVSATHTRSLGKCISPGGGRPLEIPALVSAGSPIGQPLYSPAQPYVPGLNIILLRDMGQIFSGGK